MGAVIGFVMNEQFPFELTAFDLDVAELSIHWKVLQVDRAGCSDG